MSRTLGTLSDLCDPKPTPPVQLTLGSITLIGRQASRSLSTADSTSKCLIACPPDAAFEVESRIRLQSLAYAGIQATIRLAYTSNPRQSSLPAILHLKLRALRRTSLRWGRLWCAFCSSLSGRGRNTRSSFAKFLCKV